MAAAVVLQLVPYSGRTPLTYWPLVAIIGHMAAPSTSRRYCGHHHGLCDFPDPDLNDTLRDLHLAGVTVTPTSPQLLDLCDVFPDGECAEQAEAIVRTTRPANLVLVFEGDKVVLRDPGMTVWHLSCSGCLWDAVASDVSSRYRVEIFVPTHTAGVAA